MLVNFAVTLFALVFGVQSFDVTLLSTKKPTNAECQVTHPNGIAAVGGDASPSSYGVTALSTVGLPPDGVIVFRPYGPGFVTSDGSLGIKFPWQRGISGQLTIGGRRVDGDAPPLRAEVLRGYGDSGFQSSYVIFPTPGCWEVTGRVGDAQLTFVVYVQKEGTGPTRRQGPR